MDFTSANANGDPPSNPELRGTRYLGTVSRHDHRFADSNSRLIIENSVDVEKAGGKD